MLPVSAGQKAVGILVGKNLIVLLLSFINLIFCIVLGLLGREDNSWMSQSFLILLTVAVLINSVALLSSIKPLGKKKKNNIATIILVAFFLGPFLIRLVLSMVRGRRMFRRIMGSFYGFELPMMIRTPDDFRNEPRRFMNRHMPCESMIVHPVRAAINIFHNLGVL